MTDVTIRVTHGRVSPLVPGLFECRSATKDDTMPIKRIGACQIKCGDPIPLMPSMGEPGP